MPAVTYCINVNLQGHGASHQVNYWADGDGREWPNYVSSFDQLNADLHNNLTSQNVDLFTISSSGKSIRISSDKELKRAVRPLPDEGVLSVTAVVSKNERDNYYYYEGEDGYWYYGSKSDSNSHSTDGFYYKTDTFHIETKSSKIRAMLKRFQLNNGKKCYRCHSTDWKDVHYSYSGNSNYHLCSACYEDLPEEEEEDWNSTGVHWDRSVPSAPLTRYDEGSRVHQLQYLFTRLGLMPLSATDKHVGSYQGYTEEAVRKFREWYGIRGGNMGDYNKKTAKKLAEVIHQLRNEGHKYL